jgi:hypothetical protein
MEGIDLGEDDGLIDVTVSGISVRIDVWKARARLAENHNKHKGAGDEIYLDGVIEVMASFDLPRVSHRLAQKFAEAIYARAEQLKKTPSLSADSHASTGSIPAA